MGQHSKQVFVLGDLGERSVEHDGSVVLVRAEVDIVHTTYLMVKDSTPLDRLTLVIVAKIGKSSLFPKGIASSTVEDVLTYLDGLDESDPQKIDLFATQQELATV
jgi:hypothetical protein